MVKTNGRGGDEFYTGAIQKCGIDWCNGPDEEHIGIADVDRGELPTGHAGDVPQLGKRFTDIRDIGISYDFHKGGQYHRRAGKAKRGIRCRTPRFPKLESELLLVGGFCLFLGRTNLGNGHLTRCVFSESDGHFIGNFEVG